MIIRKWASMNIMPGVVSKLPIADAVNPLSICGKKRAYMRVEQCCKQHVVVTSRGGVPTASYAFGSDAIDFSLPGSA